MKRLRECFRILIGLTPDLYRVAQIQRRVPAAALADPVNNEWEKLKHRAAHSESLWGRELRVTCTFGPSGLRCKSA